jgi:hypothetical protein
MLSFHLDDESARHDCALIARFAAALPSAPAFLLASLH